MWRAKYSCPSSRVRSTSWDESHPSPFTTKSWSGKIHYVCKAVGELVKQKQCLSLNESVCLFLLDSCVWLLWAQCSYSTCSPVSLLLGQLAQVLLWPPHQHTKLTLPHKDIRGVSSSVPGGRPLPLHPLCPLSCGNSGFVQEADPWCPLGRLSTDQSKTPPYASPTQSYTHFSCTLESES